MESSPILIDTSVLIDYFRKKNKGKTLLYSLSLKYNISISTITEKNQLISPPDILIAATAFANNLSFATLNLKHFERISDLELIALSKKV
jgi:predicted nucleic acid-binding protein